MTLEWGRCKAALLQARERPIRAAGPVREKRKQAAVRWEASILELEKPASGERNSEAPGAPGRGAWYGACPWRARLEIRSLGTIPFWGANGVPEPLQKPVHSKIEFFLFFPIPLKS